MKRSSQSTSRNGTGLKYFDEFAPSKKLMPRTENMARMIYSGYVQPNDSSQNFHKKRNTHFIEEIE